MTPRPPWSTVVPDDKRIGKRRGDAARRGLEGCPASRTLQEARRLASAPRERAVGGHVRMARGHGGRTPTRALRGPRTGSAPESSRAPPGPPPLAARGEACRIGAGEGRGFGKTIGVGLVAVGGRGLGRLSGALAGGVSDSVGVSDHRAVMLVRG